MKRYCIRRTKQNFEQVNAHFNKLVGRNMFTANGKRRLADGSVKEYDYIHYPKVNNTYRKDYIASGYTELDLSDLKQEKMEFKVGDKVKIPTRKTDDTGISLEKCSVMYQIKCMKQDFIYVTYIDGDRIIVGVTPTEKASVFRASDLELYEENPEVVKMHYDSKDFHKGEYVIMVAAGGWSYSPDNNGCLAVVTEVGYRDLSGRKTVQTVYGKVLNPVIARHSEFQNIPVIDSDDRIIVRKATKEEILNYFKSTKTMKKGRIIGYKCPMDMYDGNPKAGAILKLTLTGNSYSETGNSSSNLLPKQIVETWEPVYEEELQIGDWVIAMEDVPCNGSARTITKGSFNKIKGGASGSKIWFEDTPYGGGNYEASKFRKATEEELKNSKEVLTLGNHDVKVIVKRDIVHARGGKFDMKALEEYYNYLMDRKFGNKVSPDYEFTPSTSVRFIRIGCTGENNLFSLDEIKRVIDTYKRLQ